MFLTNSLSKIRWKVLFFLTLYMPQSFGSSACEIIRFVGGTPHRLQPIAEMDKHIKLAWSQEDFKDFFAHQSRRTKAMMLETDGENTAFLLTEYFADTISVVHFASSTLSRASDLRDLIGDTRNTAIKEGKLLPISVNLHVSETDLMMELGLIGFELTTRMDRRLKSVFTRGPDTPADDIVTMILPVDGSRAYSSLVSRQRTNARRIVIDSDADPSGNVTLTASEERILAQLFPSENRSMEAIIGTHRILSEITRYGEPLNLRFASEWGSDTFRIERVTASEFLIFLNWSTYSFVPKNQIPLRIFEEIPEEWFQSTYAAYMNLRGIRP